MTATCIVRSTNERGTAETSVVQHNMQIKPPGLRRWWFEAIFEKETLSCNSPTDNAPQQSSITHSPADIIYLYSQST